MRLSWLLLLAACNGTGLDSDGGSRPPTGVYQASEVITSNDCQPVPPLLQGREGLVFDADHIFAPLPIPSAVTSGFEGFKLPYDGLAVDLNFCGAQRSFMLEVRHLDDHNLDLRRTTTWSGTAAAKPGCGAPVNDCSSIEDFHFSLVDACAASCVSGPPTQAVCSCP